MQILYKLWKREDQIRTNIKTRVSSYKKKEKNEIKLNMQNIELFKLKRADLKLIKVFKAS